MQPTALRLALALIAAPAAASAATPMSLVLIGMDPNFAGAVDASTLKTEGDIVSLDMVTVAADPNGAGEGYGRIAVSHMSFDCKRSMMTLTGGFSQSQTGDELKPVEAHDWTKILPDSPGWATFQYGCAHIAPQPVRAFPTVEAMQAFYEGELARTAKAPPPKR